MKSEWCFTHPQLRRRRHRLLQRSLNKSPPIWVQRWKAISHQGMSSNAMAHSAVGCPAGREHWVGSRTRFCKSTIYKSMSSEYVHFNYSYLEHGDLPFLQRRSSGSSGTRGKKTAQPRLTPPRSTPPLPPLSEQKLMDRVYSQRGLHARREWTVSC